MRAGPLHLPFVSLLLLGAALPLTLGLGECLNLLDCEPDASCEDPTRAQIRGVVAVPESGAAAAGLTRVDDQLAAAVKTAMADALARAATHARKHGGPRASRHNATPAVGKDPVERFRAGEVIVRAKESVRERKAELARHLELILQEGLGQMAVDVRLCGTDTRCLAEITSPDGKPLDLAATAKAAAILRESPFLEWAEKNLILQMSRTPNDEFFTLQWHYAALDLPSAWDITTGSPSLVAAVIDTGILLDHPDLRDRVLGTGADLIDDPRIANDGDGRDNDGDDPGDAACGGGCHSFHGSHVAGTIGAESNDGDLVSGVTWSGGILPVRVLGVGGGTLSDIADGVEWSVGNEVDGVRRNATPADVINMSLGGYGTSRALNESIAGATERGVIVVVAAGNEAANAADFTPANAPAAITVAAHGNTSASRPRARRTSYSNTGPNVTVAAPGGELSEDVDRDGQPDGVLSTLDDFVSFYQGTSMAAPHVAGIAMLLKSMNPDISQEEVRRILTESADPNLECTGCGAGRVSALGALRALGADNGAAVVPSPAFLRIGAGQRETSLVFKNFDNVAREVTLAVGGSDRLRCALSRQSGSLPPAGTLTVMLEVERTDDANDSGECTVTAASASGTGEARIVWTGAALERLQQVDVGAVRVEEDGSLRVADIVTTDAVSGYAYDLVNLDPGTYLVVGIADVNADGDYDDAEDAVGIYVPPTRDGTACNQASCGRVRVRAGDIITNADFVVAPGFNGDDESRGGTGDGSLGDGCASSSACSGGLYCEGALPGGYCTTDCLSDAECPGEGACFRLAGGDGEEYSVCLLTCVTSSACRTDEGYACDIDNTCFPQ